MATCTRLALIAAMAMATAACTTANSFTPTMEADPSEVGNEGLALVTEMLSAYEAVPASERSGLCDLVLPSYQEEQKHSYRRYGARVGSAGQRTEDLFRCRRFKRDPEVADVARYLKNGFALSDLYCENFFRRIALRWSQRRFARDTTNDVGAAVSAILGLTNVASPVTGGVGAAFGLIDGTFRNYDEIFVVDADLPGLQKLVRAERTKIREKLAPGKNYPTEYSDAFSAIQHYATLCSYIGMKGLLSESMERQARETSGSGRVQETYTEFMTRKERDAAELEEIRADLAERQRQAAERRAAAEKAVEEMNKPAEEETEGAKPEGTGTGSSEEETTGSGTDDGPTT